MDLTLERLNNLFKGTQFSSYMVNKTKKSLLLSPARLVGKKNTKQIISQITTSFLCYKG